MTIPFSLSLVVCSKAEHRNSEEDGQNDVRGNNADYGLHVYKVTGAALCGGLETWN